MLGVLVFTNCSKDNDIKTVNEPEKLELPDDLSAIDLGLPSGTKWANMNLGAKKPWDYGSYYAWAESVEKAYYDETVYTYVKDNSYVYFGNICGTDQDVAHEKWGAMWQIPSLEQFQELLEHCVSRYKTYNRVNGLIITSKVNGNSIFLPAAGKQWKSRESVGGDYGCYWTGTQNPNNPECVYSFEFWVQNMSLYDVSHRGMGVSIRPIMISR